MQGEGVADHFGGPCRDPKIGKPHAYSSEWLSPAQFPGKIPTRPIVSCPQV